MPSYACDSPIGVCTSLPRARGMQTASVTASKAFVDRMMVKGGESPGSAVAASPPVSECPALARYGRETTPGSQAADEERRFDELKTNSNA